MGFAHRQQVYLTGENPFLQGTTRHVRSITTGAESRAVWRVDIPERGEYALYVSYDSTPGSVDDALYTVRHLGGESRFAVNQTMGAGRGSTSGASFSMRVSRRPSCFRTVRGAPEASSRPMP